MSDAEVKQPKPTRMTCDSGYEFDVYFASEFDAERTARIAAEKERDDEGEVRLRLEAENTALRDQLKAAQEDAQVRYEPTVWPCCGQARSPLVHHDCPVMQSWERAVAIMSNHRAAIDSAKGGG